MDYTQFYCKECKHWGCDAVANGVCYHPEVNMPMDGLCRACFRLDLIDKLKWCIGANIVGV